MAYRKISELTALSSANLQDADLLPIVDFDITNSDSSPANTSKQTKSITIGDLKTSIFTNPTFSETITITRSGTGVPTAPQLILKDADGTNETTHIYNHSGRTAIVGRNENAKGIIDFIQDDGTTQNTAMKISSQSFVGIDEVTPRAPLHINVTDFPAGTPRGIIIQRDANADGTIMGTITFNNGENLDSPENNSPRFDGNIARIRTTLQSNVDDNSPNPDAGGSMALQTKEEGGSLETRIEIRESGMIGMGTSTPARPLHIKTADSLSLTTQQKTHPLMVDGVGDSIFDVRGGTSTAKVGIDFGDNTNTTLTGSPETIVTDINNGGSSPGGIIYENEHNKMRIKTNSADAITIDSSGNSMFKGAVLIGDGTGSLNNLTFNSQHNYTQTIDFQEGGTSALAIQHAPAESVNKLKILFDNDSGNYPHGQLQFTNQGGMNILGPGSISVATGSISTTSGGFYANGTGGGPSGTGSFNLPEAAGAQFFKKRPGGGAGDYDRAILNNESDTTPIRNIRRMTQSDYDAMLDSPTGVNNVDANTLYIIV